jgi:hypothetical protein
MYQVELPILAAESLARLRRVPARRGRPPRKPADTLPDGTQLWRCGCCDLLYAAVDMAVDRRAVNGIHTYCRECKLREGREYKRTHART